MKDERSRLARRRKRGERKRRDQGRALGNLQFFNRAFKYGDEYRLCLAA
jgi:hypothetical protein